MPRMLKTDVFTKWIKKLKDSIAKAHINRRIYRLERGILVMLSQLVRVVLK